MKYWKAPCQEQSSTSSKMDWITSDCLKRPCLPYQQRAHCKVWHIVIILLLVYKNMVMSVMSRVCPDKSCYDCYILSLVPHTKIQGDHFHLVFLPSGYFRTELFFPAVQLMRMQGSCLRKQDSLLHVWYPSYQDMHEPFPFLPLLKLRKKKWWDRWMHYQCSKGHEIKRCGRFAKSG